MTRPLALAIAAAALLGGCTNQGSNADGTNQAPAMAGREGASDENPVGGAPGQGANTRADRAGSIGPGSTAGTSSVHPTKQSTRTRIDSVPNLRIDAGPGSQ